MKNTAYIIAAKRTAVIPKGGAFCKLKIHELAAPVINGLLKKANISRNSIDELILSNAVGGGGNPARPSVLASNLPESIGGFTIDRQCAGGLDAIWLAAQMIMSGTHNIVIAGGAESASLRPIRMAINNTGAGPVPYDQPNFTGLEGRDPGMLESMAEIAYSSKISRDKQEDWAINSHRKALNKKISDEIIDINNQTKDSFTRNLSKKICQRAPILKGNITSATTAVDSDAAAFCLIVNEEIAKKYSNAIKIVAGVSCAGTPDAPAFATLNSIKRILDATEIVPYSFNAIEIMEAYAAQALIATEAFKFNENSINRSGGALARGHPIGASGAILAVRLYHELQNTGGFGLASIAAAGGLGSSLILSCSSP